MVVWSLGLWSIGSDLDLKRTYKNTCDTQKTTPKWFLESVPAKAGASGLKSEMSVHWVRSFQTYTWSLHVLIRQRLVFLECGYKYPHTPFSHLSLSHFKQNTLASQERALSLPLFHSWLISSRDSSNSDSVARAKIRASELPFLLLSTKFSLSRWTQACYYSSLVLLDD